MYKLRVFSGLFALAAFDCQAATLPDTGQENCSTASGAATMQVAADDGSHPRQDCRYGADAAERASRLVKAGAGTAGFDYTKIANDGGELGVSTALGSASNEWACTRDNLTGLVWEVKTPTSSSLRYQGWSYVWYLTDPAINGGHEGFNHSGGPCLTQEPLNLGCSLQQYVTEVNTAGLCAFNDWRVPTRRELHSLISYRTGPPYMDPIFFPDYPGPTLGYFWTSSSTGGDHAWVVEFDYGRVSLLYKSNSRHARLVRGAGF